MRQKNSVVNAVASIVIIGHVIVFLNALALGVLSMVRGIDAVQTLLMASPILAVTALAAFTTILDDDNNKSVGTVSTTYAFFVILFPCLLVAVVCALFYLFWQQIDGFGPDQLKISLGAVETFFGVFLGTISKALFGKANAISAQ